MDMEVGSSVVLAKVDKLALLLQKVYPLLITLLEE